MIDLMFTIANVCSAIGEDGTAVAAVVRAGGAGNTKSKKRRSLIGARYEGFVSAGSANGHRGARLDRRARVHDP